MSQHDQIIKAIEAECGLQPKAESQASTCIPKFRMLPKFRNAQSATPASQKGPGQPQKGRERLCSLCKTVPSQWSHCQPCHSLYNRVYHCKTGLDIESIKVWDKIDKGNKADFIRSCRALTSFELKARMKQFISREQQSMITTSLCGTGRFLDKQGLQLKYEDKPYQLKHILENANMVVDPITDLP